MTVRDTGQLVSIAPEILWTIRRSTERALGDQAAQLLQEAGFSAGDQFYEAFRQWLRNAGNVSEPEDLDASYLDEVMREFLRTTGWGTVEVTQLGGAALQFDSADWAEAAPNDECEFPSCHVTTGLLAAFFGRLAEDVVAVMEVECRSRGDNQCRFLAGSPETLQAVYEGMSQGADYQAILAPVE